MIATIFNEILVRPFFNILVFFYGIIPDFGVAIILLTILIKFILYPLQRRAIKTQKAMVGLQPKVKEIRQKYKDNFKKQHEALQKLYEEHNIKSPLSGCLPILIQLPVLLALFRVFSTGFEPEKLSQIYSFISRPEAINPFFLGILDLSVASPIMAFLAAAAQFFQTKATLPKNKNQAINKIDFQSAMSKQMLYFMPVLTLVFSLAFPSALALYWFVSTALLIFQQKITTKNNHDNIQENKK
jgi:YidC/Oxa1 family membrane protein insertase